MRNPFTCQSFLLEENRLSKGREFFNSFFSLNPEKLQSYIEIPSVEDFQKYSKGYLQAPGMFCFSNFHIIEKELAKRGENIVPVFEDCAKIEVFLSTAEVECLNEQSAIILSKLSSFDEKMIQHFLEAILPYLNTEKKFLTFFEIVHSFYPSKEIALRFLCQLIRNGKIEPVDKFILLLKEKRIDILDPEIIAFLTPHFTGKRTFGDLISLSSFYSNNFEMYERFSDLRTGPSQLEEFRSLFLDYRSLDVEMLILFLVFGYLSKRNPDQFFQIVKAEDCFNECAIQSLIVLTGHTDAIRLMFRNISPRVPQTLVKMCSGDPQLKRQILEVVGNYQEIELLDDVGLPFLQSLIASTCNDEL
ncbi:hypothetical protein pv_151 [Pithovirus sibericum]|uniref:Uncharacterized protein n=1 Tax=Pithovirus sibericum TaxID=1450746 RepID=W5S4P1_9VIRU|nr:hypothetical protein pv_151 [Pithovirus sibericum]AHH01718.1 hypothetical protein pv_151 [Pithovirus sibericum]